MRNRSLSILVCCAITLSMASSVTPNASLAAVTAPPANMDELRADRLKTLSKKDPRAEDLVNKANANLEKLKQASPTSPLVERTARALEQIIYGTASLGETQFKLDMEVLEAMGKDHKELTTEELAPLQERYKKLCENFDDMVFTKDLDRAFHIHDKFVRFTSLGLWDKDKISSELERMEGLVERAPDIPYGKAQLFDTTKSKRLMSVPKLVYLGTSPHEEMYLTFDRRSTALIEPPNMELAEHIIQAPDGKMLNLNECNDPQLGLPFSPPLSLWAKSRILEAKVPAVLFKIVDSKVKTENPVYASAQGDFLAAADIADGKLDEYLKTNVKLLGPDKTPAMLGLFSEFDRETAATAFGADGHTPFYMIADPKLKDMPEAKRSEEIKKRLEKGSFAGGKAPAPDLCNQYGDKAIPDGPERVRDAWKRTSKLINENSNGNINLFSCAGAFHGNKNAAKYPGEQLSGNQVWNKLEYYWPGENVLDWIGINAVGADPQSDPKGANIMEAIDPFMQEVRSSAWQATPVMLVNLAAARSRVPLAEGGWINTMFNKVIPATFPNILAVFVSIPEGVTLWTPEARSAFRSYVSSNKFYNFKFRFKSL